MDIGYVEYKLREIRKKKAKILSEINGTDYSEHCDLFLKEGKFERKFTSLREKKIACIMDEFTYNSFMPECNLVQITPVNCVEQLDQFNPDLFFLESAWLGKDGLWKTKVAHLSDELIEALSYCKQKNIPIIFWNKEDPIHFDTFLATAKYADFVFTTDIDCIKKYKTFLGHQRVYLMPFAAQLKDHNPIEKYTREDKFCFAGAYYKRYPERNKDLETFISVTKSKGLDIFDRNFYKNDPNYSFPPTYRKYIKGHLMPTEIDKAYKGYRFNINMNSVKQSQSMCARRVFELLASNTVTISNYSRAVRNLLGDLVVCTDDGQQLEKQLEMFSNEEYYNKFRLLGLRKILSEHTYTHRLEFITDIVYENKLNTSEIQVAIIAKAETQEDIQYAISQFERQSYKNSKLFIISELTNIDIDSKNIIICGATFENLVSQMTKEFDYLAFISLKDYYGANYIRDLVLTTQYVNSPVIGKNVYFKYNDGGITKHGKRTYVSATSVSIRRSLIRLENFIIDDIIAYSRDIDNCILDLPCFTIDEYNYCENFNGHECPIVDDLVLTDQGLDLDTIQHSVLDIKLGVNYEESLHILPSEIYNCLDKSSRVKIRNESGGLYIDSDLVNAHEYMYMNYIYDVDDLTSKDDLDVFLDLEYVSKFEASIVVLLLDNQKNKIDSIVKSGRTKVHLEISQNVKFLKLGIRLANRGKCIIKGITIGNFDYDNGCFLNKSKVLLVTDNYLDYENLYRYAFVHSRVLEYKENGTIVDVLKLSDRFTEGYSEFNNINVTTVNHENIHNILMNCDYETVLIHFLSESIWNSIKNYVKGKKIIVWVHGSDIQPWWRRSYNYSTEKEIEVAKQNTKKRMEFWKEIFNNALSNRDYNFHFIFVSKYFAESIFEDLDIQLPLEKYSIIHNYINKELFNYSHKNNEMRKKILSIRPFNDHTYANDLTVKAILTLSKEQFFKELEFRIVGRGKLFKSTLKALRKFKNVIIEEKFLRQSEIAEVHKDYGVFLVPTRMDSQGVSRDEAMASGLVPITNNVAAIPEFVDEDCGMLVESEDYIGLAESIKKLYNSPELFQELSRNAAKRVEKQSGYEETIRKEIQLIRKE